MRDCLYLRERKAQIICSDRERKSKSNASTATFKREPLQRSLQAIGTPANRSSSITLLGACYLEAATNMAVVANRLGVRAFVNVSQMTPSEMSDTETASSTQ